MDNKIWIWIIVVIVVIGGIWYFVAQNSSNSITATGTASSTDMGTSGTGNTSGTGTIASGTVAPAQVVGFGSIQDLIALKQNLTCSISLGVSGVTRSGTMYIGPGLMRGDFFATLSGEPAVTSMIDNTTSLYVWSTAKSTGLQLSASVSANGSAIATAGGIDPQTKFNYYCQPVQPINVSVFEPPTDVSFSSTVQ
jgi:hypothetical protein